MDPHILAHHQHQVFIQQRPLTAYQQQFCGQENLLRQFGAACLRWLGVWPPQSSLLALNGRQAATHRPCLVLFFSSSTPQCVPAVWFLINHLSGSLCILHQLCHGLLSALATIGGRDWVLCTLGPRPLAVPLIPATCGCTVFLLVAVFISTAGSSQSTGHRRRGRHRHRS